MSLLSSRLFFNASSDLLNFNWKSPMASSQLLRFPVCLFQSWLVQGVPEWLLKSRTLVFGLGTSVGDKSYGKTHLIPIHFDFRFRKCQNIEFFLPNSSVSKFGKYWIYKGIVFLFTIMILLLLSFLGILSVWSEILQKEGKCTLWH